MRYDVQARHDDSRVTFVGSGAVRGQSSPLHLPSGLTLVGCRSVLVVHQPWMPCARDVPRSRFGRPRRSSSRRGAPGGLASRGRSARRQCPDRPGAPSMRQPQQRQSIAQRLAGRSAMTLQHGRRVEIVGERREQGSRRHRRSVGFRRRAAIAPAHAASLQPPPAGFTRPVDRLAVVRPQHGEAQHARPWPPICASSSWMVTKLPTLFDIFSPSTCRKPLCIQ